MAERSLPPPYSLTADVGVEQPTNPTPRPNVGPEPPFLRSPPFPASAPGSSHSHDPSSNLHVPNPFHAAATYESLGTTLNLSAFQALTKKAGRELVTLKDIVTHLKLLRAFRLFRQKVESLYSNQEVGGIVPDIGREIGVKGRWLWFLEMAVERFRRWVELLAIYDGGFVTPPVDVWLVWHTYMLNPSWYMEDCKRLLILRPLSSLEVHPLDLSARMGDDILNYQPTLHENEAWVRQTGLYSDPFLSAGILVNLDVECPKCGRGISTPILNATDNTGFAQTGFVIVCPHCGTYITRESLGVGKFIKDIVLDGEGAYLPGTLLSLKSGTFDTSSAAKLKANISYLEVFRNDDAARVVSPPLHDTGSWKKAIGERLRYNALELRKNVERAVGIKDKLLRRVLGAYTDGKPFSVELVAAAMRQSTFVDKIHELGWLNPGFWRDADSIPVLQHCIARYHGFLTLLSNDSGNKTLFVPTLDIDLVWHTHQLCPKTYYEDCRKIAFKLIDHDDQVEEGRMSVGLDHTSRAWWSQFGIPYMHCGCPVKDTIWERLSRGISSRNDRIDPPMNRNDCHAATHSSEHNSVFLVEKSQWRRTLQQASWQKQRENERRKLGKGKQGGESTEIQQRLIRWRDHEFPFSSPIPGTEDCGYGCPHAQRACYPACAVGVSGCSVRP